MPGGLSPSEITAYWRDGVIFPISVLSAARVSELPRKFEALKQSLGGRPRRSAMIAAVQDKIGKALPDQVTHLPRQW
jgi:hypothetical protein